MEQIKQILQLKNDDIGIREIVRGTGMSRNSVRKYFSRLDNGPLSDKEIVIRLTQMNNLKVTRKESVGSLSI